MAKKRLLNETFIVSPYSVLDCRSVAWRQRKQWWREQLCNPYETREGTLYDALAMRLPQLYQDTKEERERLGMSFEDYVEQYVSKETLEKEIGKAEYSGVSSLDPVLCEVVYKWFTPQEGCRVFNPFAGGITSGAVACKCGYEYTGVELRQERVESNNVQATNLGIAPTYICDDACNINAHLGVATQDLLFTCPPYYDLEVYSDLPNDASNQPTYARYIAIMQTALTNALLCLRQNRFAVVVVSDVRGENGAYYDLPGDIIRIFRSNGCHLWNDIVLINSGASAWLRARRYMRTRKTVRTHQRVLVFYYGRPSTINKIFKQIQ